MSGYLRHHCASAARAWRSRLSDRAARLAMCAGVVCLLSGATPAAPLPFDPPIDLPGAPDAPVKVAAGDLDGDGDIDFLAASELDGSIRWFENDGAADPTFTDRLISAMAPGASSVNVGDMDGDGDLDVLACSDEDDKVAWHENMGGAPLVFIEHVITEDPDGAGAMEGDADSPADVLAADLDGDGDLDVCVAALGAGTVLWLESDGASPPVFTLRTVGAGLSLPMSVRAIDVNQDGLLDVVSAAFLGNSVQWHENDGGSPPMFTLRSVSNIPSFPTDVDGADIDGDGDIDVVGSSSNDDSIRWYENLGFEPPIFLPHVIASDADGARSVQAVDLDTDGDIDVVGASSVDNRITWYENDGASPPMFTTRTIRFGEFGVSDALAADFDGDGDLDVVGAIRTEDHVAVYENLLIHRESAYADGETIGTVGDPRGLSTGDVNRDGRLDVLVASSIDDSITWLVNDGLRVGSFSPVEVSTSSLGAFDVVAADVNQDGFLDVVGAADDQNRVSWFEHDGMDPPGFSEHIVDAAASSARAVDVADIDGDGDPDIAAALEGSGSIVWYDQAGGVFTKRTLTASADGASDVVIADLNGDGRLDIAAVSRHDDELRWFENLGGDPAMFMDRVIDGDPDGGGAAQGEIDQPIALCAGDLDGDGDVDLATASASDSSVVMWENMGGDPPVFTPMTISNLVQFAWDVQAADLDADGDLDLIAAALLGNLVVTFINDGASDSTFTRRDAGASPFAHAVLPADIDGDGDMDILSSAVTADAVLAFENVGGQLRIEASDVAPVSVEESDEFEFLRIEVQHAGRPGDSPLELLSMDFVLETAPGVNLTQMEGELLLNTISLYLDEDGSEDVDPNIDTAVATRIPNDLMNGEATFTFADGLLGARIEHGQPNVYFLRMDVADNGADADVAMIGAVQPSGAGAVTAEDRMFDLPATISPFAEVASGFVEIIEVQCPADISGDGIVNAQDLAEVIGHWGTNDPKADLNEDGVVGSTDLGILLGFWNCMVK